MTDIGGEDKELDADLCPECGRFTLNLIGVVNKTKIYVCVNCYFEKSIFMGFEKCEHKFNTRGECMHCGNNE